MFLPKIKKAASVTIKASDIKSSHGTSTRTYTRYFAQRDNENIHGPNMNAPTPNWLNVAINREGVISFTP